MIEETNNKVKEIKRSFRLMMNGVASQSMRQKGAEYQVNWGIGLVELRNMAAEYGKNYDLAIALWKENIRECKILATMIMPVEEMLTEVADIWMEQTPTQEIAEIAAFQLYQYLADAPVLAFKWLASGKTLYEICGFQVLARLFMQGLEPDERGINELMDQALAALQSEHAGVRHAAMNCIQRFAGLGADYETIARKALSSVGTNLDFF
ncbi:MAG: DNA alkylation repair protein [Bacteroidales bacterium]|nr:DNA alkylation repair protein [Bacteroidales bacterium]